MVVVPVENCHWSFRRSRLNRQLPAEQAAIFERASSFHLPIFLRVGSMNGKNRNYAAAAEKKDFNSVFHN